MRKKIQLTFASRFLHQLQLWQVNKVFQKIAEFLDAIVTKVALFSASCLQLAAPRSIGLRRKEGGRQQFSIH